jgi:hypothetical protein
VFTSLSLELEKWCSEGLTAQFWWRDDDVQHPSLQLDQLLGISAQHSVALSLATIPQGVSAELVRALSRSQEVSILQHGFNHQNHAPATERKMELGWHRPAELIVEQISKGRSTLQSLFGEQFVGVMVPPWNRIDSRVVGRLPGIGLYGLSTLGPRDTAQPSVLQQVNVHVDIINWREGCCFAGEQACTGQIVSHLSAKREGRADPAEPTGIMSHHLVHDAGCWAFLDQLFTYFKQQENIQIVSAEEVFSNNPI